MEFTAHNIRLDDGTFTKPDIGYSIDKHPWFLSAEKILKVVFPERRDQFRIADLGCSEGGYAVGFARIGFQTVGIEVRESNIAACNYVKSKVDLPNLSFIRDNVLNVVNYGRFDAIFCCGLLYHLDNPKQFLYTVSPITNKLIILQTHFALPTEGNPEYAFPSLSEITENEGLLGRWYPEFISDEAFAGRENAKWASWDNRKSFWLQREYLLQAIYDVGFDIVMEQYDSMAPDIANDMLRGYYGNNSRGTFIGIKV